ncbi:MAG: DNA polymerase I [Bacteroidia bacterium]|nr:DNA polymerase I [Bacteroidia bacterium]MDW8159410.1 DNA polymerase I [Bacteroidia bacterium]
MRKLFLLDAMALIFRAYYALIGTPRINSKGQNTSAIFGFTNTLLEIIQKENPTHLGVIFESTTPTFRHEKFPDYKAHRDEVPEDITNSVPWIMRVLQAMQIYYTWLDGYEADDVIGTLANQAAAQGFEVYMVTPDKDYAQLVHDSIFLFKPGRSKEPNKIFDAAAVLETYGVPPDKITDYLGLVGDSVDNIPGIPKIGEKTALALLKEYGSLEEILAKAEYISKKAIRETLVAHKEQGILSKELATIITNAPITFDAEALVFKQPDSKALKSVLEELEFRSIISRLFPPQEAAGIQQSIFPSPDFSRGNDNNVSSQNIQESSKQESSKEEAQQELSASSNSTYRTIQDIKPDYRLCQSTEELQELALLLENTNAFCFDTETTSLEVHQTEIVGIAFAIEPHKAYYVPFSSDFQEVQKKLSFFKGVLESSKHLKIGQNLKFDILVLHQYGIEVCPPLFDTMLAHYVCHSDQPRNMDALARSYLGYSPIPISELIGPKGKKQISMREVPVEKVKDYAAEDADITLQLMVPLQEEMQKLGLRKLFDQVEMPLVPVLVEMEKNGVCIDVDFLREYSLELEKELGRIEQNIYQLSGTTFNINSPRQLGEVLFEKLGLRKQATLTATGQYATSEKILIELAEEGHELPLQIIQYRQLMKLKSTYVDALPQMVNPKTGRVHTSFNQAVVVTGRLSSNNPNLQNIPVRTEQGKEVRKAFIAPSPEYVLLSADYSQIELRIMAALSQDENLCQAFKDGLDIHQATAANIFGVPLDKVTSEMRRKAKTVNFGIIYGISAFGLASRLGISRTEAQIIIKSYFEKYPGVAAFMERCKEEARKKGYAETLLGRRHYLKDIQSKSTVTRGVAERNAINTPIQGTAADMIKLAMIHIHACLREFKTKMILQVHDELLFEVPFQELEPVEEIVKSEMENALPLPGVAVEVNLGIGKNWLDAH